MSERKQRLDSTDAKAAGIGAAAALPATPFRVRSNAAKNPYKGMKEGPHSVPMADVHRSAQRAGHRIQNTAYTANRAVQIREGNKKLDTPLKIVLHPDGHASQVDGAHSTWANTMNGATHQKVEVQHTDSPRPAKQGYKHVMDSAFDVRHRRRLRQASKMTPAQVQAKARTMNPHTPDRNEVFSDSRKMAGKWFGRSEAEQSLHLRRGPSTGLLRTKQGAILAGGAVAGIGANHILQGTKKQTVSKSISAFGIDHG